MLFYKYIHTPIGELELCANNEGLVSVLFTSTVKRELAKQTAAEHPVLTETEQQLNAYFNKSLTAFNLPLALDGTEFQKRVWNQLTKTPFGKTINYLELAKQLGDEKCIRAAASANGKNPISIIIPCHRIIGSDGSLVGYSGNLERKQWLLQHEGAYQDLFS
jgi:methylated-DNA-[protein]-cysteine S-methyltransferase